MSQLVSEWLSELGSHEMYNAVSLQDDFEKSTGKTDKLPTHTVGETRKALANDYRGGSVSGKDSDLVAYGYEIAFFLAQIYGSDKDRRYRQMLGRGFMFRSALDSIKAAAL